jgi:hypothetical protein
MTLVTNEQTTGLSLLEADELTVNPDIRSAVNAINASLAEGQEKIDAAYLIKHLEANQFYLPQLLIIDKKFVISFFDKNVPAAPYIEYIDNVAPKDGKPARITLSIGNDVDQIGVSYAILEDSKVKARDYVEKINPDKFSLEQIAAFLISFIQPPVQITIPDGDYEVVSVTAEAKSTILELPGKLKVRVNSGCPNTVKKVRSKNGFIYTLSDDGLLVAGVSITQRGVPLVSADEDKSARVGDAFTFLGVTTLPTEFGSIHTALVEDSEGNRTYTKVNSKVPTLVLTKLSLGKIPVAKISGILTPGGKRKHYDVEWSTR